MNQKLLHSMLLTVLCVSSLDLLFSPLVVHGRSPSHPVMVSQNQDYLLSTANSLIRYEVGNPYFRGKTTVEVKGNGLVTVMFEQHATQFEQHTTKDIYEGQLTKIQLEDFREILATNSPLTLKSQREWGVPDERRVRFTVVEPSNQEYITELWYREQQQSLQTLIQTFKQIAFDISEGKVQY